MAVNDVHDLNAILDVAKEDHVILVRNRSQIGP
ncbi:MAG: hypothetical protein JWM65_2039 [Sphingomonas bacterium]|nr:hypothetical protein [Sphingomonas bacterium]